METIDLFLTRKCVRQLRVRYNLRRYAWSAHLPLRILTDFEEFAVYDRWDKPDKSDKAHTGRELYLDYSGYPQRRRRSPPFS